MFELRATTHLNAEEVTKRVKAATVNPLVKCAALVEEEAKRIVSKGANYSTVNNSEGEPVRVPDRNTTEFPRTITGNLRASIKYARTSRGTYIVGPQKVAWYGRVHEFGAVIGVTPKMRGYLKHTFGWVVRKARIVIPKRPFMRPALARCAARFPELFKGLI